MMLKVHRVLNFLKELAGFNFSAQGSPETLELASKLYNVTP
jgi:hypothetical protein